MVENEAINTFVRDLQVVIRRFIAAKVAEIAKVAEFLGPAIDKLREFLGLKGARELTGELETVEAGWQWRKLKPTERQERTAARKLAAR